jgi:hypothetical protein
LTIHLTLAVIMLNEVNYLLARRRRVKRVKLEQKNMPNKVMQILTMFQANPQKTPKFLNSTKSQSSLLLSHHLLQSKYLKFILEMRAKKKTQKAISIGCMEEKGARLTSLACMNSMVSLINSLINNINSHFSFKTRNF